MAADTAMGQPGFLETLGADPAELAKLRSLGAETPAALLSMISASPEVFEQYLGPAAARRVLERLNAIVPKGAPTRKLAHPPGGLGASTVRGPVAPLPPPYDLAERDRLYGRLQALRARDAAPAEVAAAERALEDLLAGRKVAP